MKPEEIARQKIDKQINNAGWDVVDRDAYIPMRSQAVREFLMKNNKESDYLFFIDEKAIAVLEAKKEDNHLGEDVAVQAEWYAANPLKGCNTWFTNQIPLVYVANGKKIFYRNMLDPNSKYKEIKEMHSPKEMLRLIGRESRFGKLPRISHTGLRDCQYDALSEFEDRLRNGDKKFLATLATGSGKTYLACLMAYRQLAYTDVKRVLFLVDRNNLGKQAAVEFSTFSRTETGTELSKIYSIRRLRKNSDIAGSSDDPSMVVISTVQKLYSFMTGENFSDDNEDEEDEKLFMQMQDSPGTALDLDEDNIKLPHDYFQFIIVDECHRSIYGKWSNVLKYFNQAIIVGLTATPTPEAYAFFDKNIIENYTYEESVVDGVNVPYDVFITKTEITEHGGVIEKGDSYEEISNQTGASEMKENPNRFDYGPTSLNKSIIVESQIDAVITQFRESIYKDMFPERKSDWRYIPKTLIFAKNDNHATEIVRSCERIFAPMFSDGKVPNGFVQKITYSAGDSDMLIQQFRSNPDFRIAVTVTLVSTGTDIKPLEVVAFMADVKSSVLYQQMKGRGCRTISDSLLREVTPNADTKSRFIIFDAVGVTASDKSIPIGRKQGVKKLSLEQLLEDLSHKKLTDDNLLLLSDYCSSINQRYDNNSLLKSHIAEFLESFGFLPRTIAESITKAFDNDQLPAYVPNGLNKERFDLISILMLNTEARKKLLELRAGYKIKASNEDTVIFAGFDTESVRSHIDSFEKFINDHVDDIEALRIIYNSGLEITMPLLEDLKAKLLSADSSYTIPRLWSWYKMADTDNSVGDPGREVSCLTNLIQIVRYAYKQSQQLVSISKYANSRFNLYAGQMQNTLTEEQIDLMKIISEYVAINGIVKMNEFINIDMDLWRQMIQLFDNQAEADKEIFRMSRFILKAV